MRYVRGGGAFKASWIVLLASLALSGCFVVSSGGSALPFLSDDASTSPSSPQGASFLLGPKSWIGGFSGPTSGWTRTGATFGTADAGGFQYTYAAASDDTYLYVPEYSNSRVSRFEKATGKFAGWIGSVATSPTGGAAGCAGLAPGNATPGWCMGGTSQSGSSDGQLSSSIGAAVHADILYVAEYSGHRISRFRASTGEFLGWIGRIWAAPTGGVPGCNGASGATPGWCTGGSSWSGTGYGHFSTPWGVAVDPTGTYLYVAEYSGGRVSRFDLATGAPAGWIGQISTAVGGSPACVAAGVGVPTPGWCTGGSAVQTTGEARFNRPSSVAVSSNHFYVVDLDNNSTLQRFNLDGTYAGWIGWINGSPTGGAAGCNGAPIGTFTPGWCTGGGSIPSVAMQGGFGDIEAVSSDGTFLYVTDASTNTVNRYGLNGAFGGWLGAVTGAPSGGAVGCTTTSIGKRTPGWCTGGSSQSSADENGFNYPSGIHASSDGRIYVNSHNAYRVVRFRATDAQYEGYVGAANAPHSNWAEASTPPLSGVDDGYLNSPRGTASDGTYLYVADRSNNRVVRLDAATGEFTGWIGRVSTTPTGGAAGCSATPPGTLTPGWCKGGTAQSGSSDGHFFFPSAVAVAGTSLFVSDSVNHRIVKYNVFSGAYQGWIGEVGNSPTGGAAGCNGLGVANPTPGWCTGGVAQSGIGAGSFNNPAGLSVQGGMLYIADFSNHRIQRVDAFSGANLGFIGRLGLPPTGGTCNGFAAGYHDSWCTAGSASAGNLEGEMSNPVGVVAAADGYLYVMDQQNFRLGRYVLSTGARAGWIGRVSTTPTGGATDCTTTFNPAPTPGWCTGGTPLPWSGAGGGFDTSGLLAVSATHLYVPDQDRSRISRFDVATGQHRGWIGKTVGALPIGGDAGCTTLSLGDFTPGWCVGGSSGIGSGLGDFNYPTAITVSNGVLFVTDTNNGRITRLSGY